MPNEDNWECNFEGPPIDQDIIDIVGPDVVNQEGRIAVIKREYALDKGLKNYIFERTTGLIPIVYVDGGYVGVCDKDVRVKDYRQKKGLILPLMPNRVHIIEVADHDHTIVSPVRIHVKGAIPIVGAVSMTFKFCINGKNDARFYENLFNSDYKKKDSNYTPEERAIIVNGLHLRNFFNYHLQGAGRDPLAGQTTVYDNIPQIRQKFSYALKHEPVFRDLDIISVDIRFRLNDYEKLVQDQTHGDMEIKREEIDSRVTIAKIELSKEEFDTIHRE